MSAIGAWWDSVSTLGRGSWGNVWDVETGAEDNRANAIEARNAELNRKRIEQALMTADQAQRQEIALARDRGMSYRSQTAEEFVTGLELGYEATAEAVNKGTGAVVGGVSAWIWKALNPKVIVVLLLAVGWWSGAIPAGITFLRGWFARKAA